MEHYHIVVRGLVQGVSYRAYTVKQAHLYKMSGYVMNTPDGSVHIYALGDKEDLDQLVIWCKRGSPLSLVKSVTVTTLPLTTYTGFEIRRTSP